MRLPALLVVSSLCCASAVAADKGVGEAFPAVELTTPDGKSVRLDRAAGEKATVVVFLSFECPVSNGYIPGLIELAKEQEKQGVAVVAVCETDEAADQVKKWVAEFKVNFPVYVDPKQKTAHALGAVATPEAFVFDGKCVLRYRGRIDDLYNARFQKGARVTSHDLKDALAAVLAGKDVATPVTKPIGCPIPQEKKAEPDAKTTYHRDVAPVLQKHCVTCHRPGEVGPFALLTYKEARRWADDIKTYTASKAMPPWMPTDGPAFRDERKLSKQEIETLAAWVDAGAPEGDPKDAPPERTFTGGWARGEPDLILTPKEAFHLGGSGRDTFRCFVMPIDIADHKWVIGYDVRPGAARVVHHTLHFYDGSGTARKLEQAEQQKKPGTDDRGPGYPVAMGVGFSPPPYKFGELPKFGGVGGWAPGQAAQFLPEGAGMFLPKGSDFVMQVHYHRDGKPADDRTQVGLYFAKKPVEQPWQAVVVEGMLSGEVIGAGEKRHVSGGAVTLKTDAVLHNVMPHMHLLGKSIKVTLTPPGGKPQTLIAIKEWDYRWQDTYWFKEPIPAAAGSTIAVEGVFDNSADNPNNPSAPPKAVTRGEQTTDEMLFAFLGATSTKKPWELVVFERVARQKEKEPEPGAEMKVLEQRLGTWAWEMNVLKPVESTTRGQETVTKELGGKVIQIKGKWDKGDSLMLVTWDAARKVYRASYYDSDGTNAEATGKYDAKAKTLTWTANAVDGGPTTTTVWKFSADDTFEWTMVTKDAKGDATLLEMKGTYKKK